MLFKILISLFAMIFPSLALTCSCVEYLVNDVEQIKASYERAASVVIAQAVTVKNINPTTTDYVDFKGKPYSETTYDLQETTFSVERSWKGTHGAQLKTEISLQCCICGYSFEEGKQYLLYLSLPEGSKYYSTSICSRTRELSESLDKELQILDDIHLTKK